MSTTAINTFLRETAALFAASGADTPELDARLLAEHVLGMTKEELFLNSEKIIDDLQLKSLKEMVKRRLLHEPVSRITGTRGFWKSEFKVSPHTLDPRADSETLVEAALKYVTPPPARVLDLGTGTGCLLISLLQEWPDARGVGLDISQGAILTAAENGIANDVNKRSKFIVLDWNLYNPDEKFDVLISNPPYISEAEMDTLDLDVLNFDPHTALVAGVDGLDAYRSIIKRLGDLLQPAGWVIFEIGYQQANQVKDLLAKGGCTVLHTCTDLGGRDRVIVARFEKVA